MPAMQYPALFLDADAAAGCAQFELLFLVKAEYGLLILAAILALEPFNSFPLLMVYALVFVGLLVLMLIRTFRKPDQDWYKCRALAESIKTAAWRYAMRAAPFGDDGQDARGDFRKFLRAIFDDNQHIGPRIAGLTPEGQQITTEMEAVRSRSLEDRKSLYLSERVQNQRKWYADKARFNKRRIKFWIVVCTFVYIVALISVFSRLKFPSALIPTEPLIVIASSRLQFGNDR